MHAWRCYYSSRTPRAVSARHALSLPAGAASPRAVIVRLSGLLYPCHGVALVAITPQLRILRRLWQLQPHACCGAPHRVPLPLLAVYADVVRQQQVLSVSQNRTTSAGSWITSARPTALKCPRRNITRCAVLTPTRRFSGVLPIQPWPAPWHHGTTEQDNPLCSVTLHPLHAELAMLVAD